jgi:type IV secretion system protein VirB6
MSFGCPIPAPDAGALRALVAAVDCNARGYAQAGFLALTGPDSFFPGALTALLIIMVALLGYRLLFGLGTTRLVSAPLIALQIGAVLALTLQWPLFQTMVFDLAYKAPIQIAAATLGRGTEVDPLGQAQAAYDTLLRDSTALDAGTTGTVAAGAGPRARAAADLAGAARTLFLATAGALSIALIAVAVLVTVGPVFIALLLLAATRGLFVGWLRALLAAALAPMVIWADSALMITVLRPNLDALTATIGQPAPNMARVDAVVTMIQVFFAAQIALVLLGVVVALGLRFQSLRLPRRERAASAPRTAAPALMMARTDQLAEALRSPSLLRSASAVNAVERTRTSLISTGDRDRFLPATSVGGVPERTGENYRRARFTDRRAVFRGEGR